MMRGLRFGIPFSRAALAAVGLASLVACSGGGTSGDIPSADPGATDDGGTNAPHDDAGGGAGKGAGGSGPEVLFPRTGITAEELGVVVDDDDRLSVSTAAYYVAKRKIPAANVVHVHIAMPTANSMTAAEFDPLRTQVDAAFAGKSIEALALTWTKPYAVDNMSITSAFSLGTHAIADTCTDPNSQYGTVNPYTKKPQSTKPFTDLGFRPAMTIPATTIEEAQALIDRGVASDNTSPKGTAYLMDTSDQTRSARCILDATHGYTNECQHLVDTWDATGTGIGASIVMANSITGKKDVLFYVQGLASVPDIAMNTFLPGAVADHLTSYGGQIPTSGQMSAFVFLKNGATGSYGTVVEPCAYQQKFPDPSVLMPRYFGGATLIEAYWKSVMWPAEGIFIGEPLARPFGTGFASSFDARTKTLTIETTAMLPNVPYLVEAADSSEGPFVTVHDQLTVPKTTRARFTIENATRKTYRFRAK